MNDLLQTKSETPRTIEAKSQYPDSVYKRLGPDAKPLLDAGRQFRLNREEIGVLVLIHGSYTNAMIARALRITLPEARRRVASIFRKLGVSTRVAAACTWQAMVCKFLPPDPSMWN